MSIDSSASSAPPSIARLRDQIRADSAFWRRFAAAGVRHLPERFIRYTPPLFGVAFGAALPEMREVVRENLRRMLGPRPAVVELADVAAVFSNYASCLAEVLLLGSGRGYRLVDARSTGVEHYFASRSKGRGLIFATAHTGGWEALGHVLSGVHYADVVVVMQRERDPRARAIQDAARARAGVRVVHVGDSALDALPLLHHLRDGAAVAMQIDRVPPGIRSREVELFGRSWRAPEGPLRLAALSGAPILPIFTRRRGFLDYEAVVYPPIELPRRPTEEALDRAARTLTGAMEKFVRANPTQWFHFVE